MFKCNRQQCVYNDESKSQANQSIIYKPCYGCYEVFYCSQECLDMDKVNHKCGQKDNQGNSDKKNNLDYTQLIDESVNQSTMSQSKKARSLDDYEFINAPKKSNGDLGRGAFGEVKLIKEKATSKLFALKIINKRNLKMKGYVEQMKKEIKIQKKLNHPHVLRFYHKFEDSNNVYFVLEYAEKGSVFQHLKKKRNITEEEAFYLFIQSCLAIDYLHKQNVIHRDLKPENLLLDSFGNIKLCDFGWSTNLTDQRSTQCGTPDYMSPEILRFEQHDQNTDIWSLGILLFELLNGFPPFSKQGSQSYKMIEEMKAAEQNGIQYVKKCSPEVKDLISKILQIDQKKRLKMEGIYNHTWCQQMLKKQNWTIENGMLTQINAATQNTQSKQAANEKKEQQTTDNISKSPIRQADTSPNKPTFKALFENQNNTSINTSSISQQGQNRSHIFGDPNQSRISHNGRSISQIPRKSQLDASSMSGNTTMNRSVSPNKIPQNHSTLFQKAAEQKQNLNDQSIMDQSKNDISIVHEQTSTRGNYQMTGITQQGGTRPSQIGQNLDKSPAKQGIFQNQQQNNNLDKSPQRPGIFQTQNNNNNNVNNDASPQRKFQFIDPAATNFLKPKENNTDKSPSRQNTFTNTGTTSFTQPTNNNLGDKSPQRQPIFGNNNTSHMNNTINNTSTLDQGRKSNNRIFDTTPPARLSNNRMDTSTTNQNNVTQNNSINQIDTSTLNKANGRQGFDASPIRRQSHNRMESNVVQQNNVNQNTNQMNTSSLSKSPNRQKIFDAPPVNRPSHNRMESSNVNNISSNNISNLDQSNLNKSPNRQKIFDNVPPSRPSNNRLDQQGINPQPQNVQGDISKIDTSQLNKTPTNKKIFDTSPLRNNIANTSQQNIPVGAGLNGQRPISPISNRNPASPINAAKFDFSSTVAGVDNQQKLGNLKEMSPIEKPKQQGSNSGIQDQGNRNFPHPFKGQQSGIQIVKQGGGDDMTLDLSLSSFPNDLSMISDKSAFLQTTNIIREKADPFSGIQPIQEEDVSMKPRLSRNAKNIDFKQTEFANHEMMQQFVEKLKREQKEQIALLEKDLDELRKENDQLKDSSQIYAAEQLEQNRKYEDYLRNQIKELQQQQKQQINEYKTMEKELQQKNEKVISEYKQRQIDLQKQQEKLEKEYLKLESQQTQQAQAWQQQLLEQQQKLQKEYERKQKDILKEQERKQKDFEDKWKDIGMQQENSRFEQSFMNLQQDQDKKIEDMRREYQQRQKELLKKQEEFQKEQKKLEQAQRDQQEKIKQQLEDRTAQLEKDYEKKQMQIKQDMERKYLQLENQMKEQETAKRKNLEKELKLYRESGNMALEEQKKYFEEQYSVLEQSYIRMEKDQLLRQEQMKEEYDKKQKQIEKEQKQLTAQLAQLNKNQNQQQSKWEESLQDHAEKMKLDYKNQREALIKEMEQKKLEFENLMQKRQNDLEKILQAKKQQDSISEESFVLFEEKKRVNYEEQNQQIEQNFQRAQQEQKQHLKELEKEFQIKQAEQEKSYQELRLQYNKFVQEQQEYLASWQSQVEQKTLSLQEDYINIQKELRKEFSKKQTEFEDRLKERNSIKRQEFEQILRQKNEQYEELCEHRQRHDEQFQRLEQSYVELQKEHKKKYSQLQKQYEDKQKEIEENQKVILQKYSQLEQNSMKQRESIKKNIEFTVQQLQQEYEIKQKGLLSEFEKKQKQFEERIRQKELEQIENNNMDVSGIMKQKYEMQEQYSFLQENYNSLQTEQEEKIKKLETEYKKKQTELEREQQILKEKTKNLEKGQEGLYKRWQQELQEKNEEIKSEYDQKYEELKEEFEKKQSEFEKKLRERESTKRREFENRLQEKDLEISRLRAQGDSNDYSFISKQRVAEQEYVEKQKELEEQYRELQQYCQNLEKNQMNSLMQYEQKMEEQIREIQAEYFKKQLELQKQFNEKQKKLDSNMKNLDESELSYSVNSNADQTLIFEERLDQSMQKIQLESQKKLEKIEKQYKSMNDEYQKHTSEMQKKLEDLEKKHSQFVEQQQRQIFESQNRGKLAISTSDNNKQDRTPASPKPVKRQKSVEQEDDYRGVGSQRKGHSSDKKGVTNMLTIEKQSSRRNQSQQLNEKPPKSPKIKKQSFPDLQSIAERPTVESQQGSDSNDPDLKKVLKGMQESINKLNNTLQNQNDLSLNQSRQMMADLSMESNLSKIRRIQMKNSKNNESVDEYYDPMINRTYLEASLLNSGQLNPKISQKKLDLLNESSLRQQARRSNNFDVSVSTISEDSRIVRQKLSRQQEKELRPIENKKQTKEEELGFFDRIKYVFGCTTRR